VTNRVQYIDEVAWRFYVAEKRDPLEHFHLVGGNIVDAPYLFVLAKIFPCRLRIGLRLRTEERLRTRIGEKKELTPIEPEHFGQTRDDLVRRMPLGRFEVPDVRGRGLDAVRDLFLGEIELPPAVAKYLTETTFLAACD